MQFPFAKIEKNRLLDTMAVIIGMLAACFFCLAYFVIGTDSYIQFHDQLDGEVLNYIYRAKYLFSGDEIIPEFMNGMQKSSMIVPAPIGILFYLFLPPFYAFAFMHLFVLIVGYIGSYWLLKKITQNSIVSMFVSCFFIYLPFYAVYGLAILGQPMLVYTLWRIYESKRIKYRYLACVFLYAISSSLALIGYAWVGILFLVIVVLVIKKKAYQGLLAAWGIMVVTYIVTNFNLIKSVFSLNSSKSSSHREEMVVYPITDVWGHFKEIFFEGVSYAYSYNVLITFLAILIILLFAIIKRGILKERLSKYYWGIVGVFSVNVTVSILATLWRIEPIVKLRNGFGGFIRTFQLDRVMWILPMCWYIVFALCIVLLIQEIKWKYAGYILVLFILFAQGNTIYENSMIYHNLRLIVFPETYILLDWDDYYAPDIYQQIDDFIGEDKSTYRTVSLGLPPAAALYNGFYCLDGYSNFYSLEYKHQFRKIISKELDKQEDMKQYFDEWGNRCYLFNSETGNFMLIDKNNNGMYKKLELDTSQLIKMGARYIFAGMEIENADELGLVLAREEPFSTVDSYYRVWLYEIYR